MKTAKIIITTRPGCTIEDSSDVLVQVEDPLGTRCQLIATKLSFNVDAKTMKASATLCVPVDQLSLELHPDILKVTGQDYRKPATTCPTPGCRNTARYALLVEGNMSMLCGLCDLKINGGKGVRFDWRKGTNEG